MPSLKNIYDDSPFGVFRTDVMGAAKYANPACTEVTGLDAKEFLGFGWFEAIDPEDRRRVHQEWRDACASNRPLDLSYRIVRPDGQRRYVRMKTRPFRAAPGEYVAVMVDTTEQVIAERRLRRNNELLSAVLENIPCGVTVYDADGSLVLDNQKFRALLRPPVEGEEAVFAEFGTAPLGRGPDAAGSFVESGTNSRPGSDFDPAPRVREEVQPDGRVLELRDAPMPTGGTITTYTDITQHKSIVETLQLAKAAAEQAAAAKAAFLATMSHEIRTPMNGLMGMTNILLDTRLTPDQRQIVEVIRQSGESLLVVLNDILDYSKIESGQMELEWLPLRLKEVVENSLLLLAPKIQEKQLELAVNVDSAIPPLILGDRTRLQQVLVNLISNAVKFTDQGQIRVNLQNATESRPGTGAEPGDLCKIAVCIEDTGIGIACDKVASIFDPFVQADSSTARRYGGTGLGLSIAKRLVEAMGGAIHIQSSPGVGTKVCFDFLAETAVPRPRAAQSLEAPLWGKRVLLLCGQRADVRVLMTQLKRWGLAVQACHSCERAVTLLREPEDFDLVVTATHQLVDARGVDFVRKLRDQGITIPAILLARSTESQVESAGMFAWAVSRTSAELDLYDALVTAIDSTREVFLEDQPESVFDDSLGQTAPLRILVAEDNEINRRVVLRMLGGFGYTADIAHNGLQVIEAVQRQAYDLVFMDIQMPHVDGLEATRFIVQNIPRDRRPRVVAMSANVMREHVEAAIAAGASQYIAKPFAPSDLRGALELAVRGDPGPGSGNQNTAHPAGSPLLSAVRVRCHLEGDRTGEFLRELTTGFASTGQELLARLETAVQAQDTVQVRAAVHEFSGMSAVVGAEKLTRVLLELQKIARAGSMKGAAVLLEQCRSVMHDTVAALQEAVREQAAQASAKRNAPRAPQPARGRKAKAR